MSLFAFSARHFRLIATHAAGNAVRSGSGIVFLLMGVLYGLSVAQIILIPVEAAMNPQTRGSMGDGRPLSTQEAVTIVEKQGKALVVWALGGKLQPGASSHIDGASPDSATTDQKAVEARKAEAIDRWANFLIDDRPGLLSGIFMLLLIGVPLLIPVIAFNQVSGDVQSKGLRYLLLRTERANIFFGRYVGTAVFTIAVVAVVVATITLYLGLKLRIYDTGPLVRWALHGFLALALLTLPYIAVCSWLSANINSPFLSLVTCGLVIGGVPLLAKISQWKWEPASMLRHLLPWGWQSYLLHYDPTHIALAAAGCLLYTAVFLTIGYLQFERRDL